MLNKIIKITAHQNLPNSKILTGIACAGGEGDLRFSLQINE